MSTLPDFCHNKSILFSVFVVTAVAANSPCAADVASCTFDGHGEATSWLGDCTGGWDSPWIVPHPAVSASIEHDRPLRPGSGPSLRLTFSPSIQKIATSVWRAPCLKNGIQVLSFDFRLESSLGANDVSIHDARYPKAISESNSAFIIRICGNKRGTAPAGHWAFYDGDRSAATIDWNRFVDSGMKCDAGKTYTCRVTLDPKDRTWKVRLSDGERTVEREGLGFRCADTEMPRYVGFGVELPGNEQKKPAGEPLVFRIDNFHYEGEVPEFAPPKVVKMPAASAHGHFITRRGDQLFDGDKPYRFFGANMPGLILPYDYWCWLDDRMVLPTPWEIEDALKTARRMNLGCLRTWNLPMRQAGQPRAAFMHVLGPRQFNEAAFVHMDYLLALANKHGCRLMIPLTADAGRYLGGINTYANYRGRSAADFYSDPQLREDYKATLKHVLSRVNTVTGVPYREDKAILAWQFGNELDRTRVPEEIQTAWQAEMAAYVKQLDPNHLLAYGRRFLPEPGKCDPNVDIVVDHPYGKNWLEKIRRGRERTKGERPFVVSEWGLMTNVDDVRTLHDTIIENGTAGAMVWSMSFHHRDGGFWWHGIHTGGGKAFAYHWPGFSIGDRINERAILEVIREKAFEIQGLPVPEITVPEAPTLLPFERVPLFSWRGSAGASSYRIERANAVEGPWRVIADDVSDADVAYRPLLSDTTAQVGHRHWYRVVARNARGDSPPSNVVGPVQIEELCLADEMKDFSLIAEKSDGWKLHNVFNNSFGEYLYRVEGNKGDKLVYQVPGPIKRVCVWTWAPSGDDILELAAGVPGGSSRKVDTVRRKRSFTPYQRKGISAIEVRHQSEDFGDDDRQLELRLKNRGWIDRVEIYYEP